MKKAEYCYHDGSQIRRGDRVFADHSFGVVQKLIKKGEYWKSDTLFVDNCVIIAFKNGSTCAFESIIIPSQKDESKRDGWHTAWKELKFLYRGSCRIKQLREKIWLYEDAKNIECVCVKKI